MCFISSRFLHIPLELFDIMYKIDFWFIFVELVVWEEESLAYIPSLCREKDELRSHPQRKQDGLKNYTLE